MTTDDYAALWDKVRLGAINGLYRGEAAGERLENTQEIEMLLGALTVVDDQSGSKRQSSERRQLNSDLVSAILSRESELLEMHFGKTSLLFASLSRFISMMDDGQDEPTEANQLFEQYKEKYANTLARSKEIKVDDVFVLAMALAAE